MSFATLHKVVTYLVAGLGLYALTLGGELTGVAAFAIGALFLASAFAEGPVIHRRWWIRGSNAAAVFGLVVQALTAALGGSLLTAGVEYAAFLQVVLLFNRRTARDHQQIALLALLHLIASTVLSAEIGFALAFVGFVVAMPWMLALSHLRRAIESRIAAGRRGGEETPNRSSALHLYSRDVVGPRFLVGTVLVTLPIFAMTLALFVAFPRVGVGFLPLSARGGQPTTGFGGSVRLGGFGTLRSDPTVVVRFRTDRPDALPARFRGTSFDYYDGRAWLRTNALEFEPLERTGTQYPVVRVSRPSDRRVQIEVEPIDEPVVFLPRGTVSLMFPPRGPFGGATGRELERRAGLDLRYREQLESKFRYTAFVSDDAAHAEVMSGPNRQRYLQLPSERDAEGIDRVAALARSLTQGIDSPRGRAERLTAWLRESGEFQYTLTLPDTGERDPLEVFLFEARGGHCEYFSTALAILLRAVGVPSRNATGFMGGRYNPYGGYYALRQADAHSWVEAYVEGAWRTYDPTPAASIAAAASDGVWAEVQALLDAARTRWARNVVAYDLRQQIAFFRSVGTRLRGVFGTWRTPDSAAVTPTSEVDRPGTGQINMGFWLGLTLTAMLLIGVALWRRRQGRSNDVPATRIYRELERALAKRGVPRPPHRTPLEHAKQLELNRFDAAAAVSRVTHQYLETRFGGRILSKTELRDLRRVVASVKKTPDSHLGRRSAEP